jgi:hypothetical protein
MATTEVRLHPAIGIARVIPAHAKRINVDPDELARCLELLCRPLDRRDTEIRDQPARLSLVDS